MKIVLSNELALPADAVTQKQAFLGMSGSGKTYGAGVFVEGLLTMGAQVVVLDVVGNWYGLRIGAKGTGEEFKIPVFGGDHGDIPLEPSGGAIIADAVVDYGISAVLDLHLLRKNQRKQFMTDFAEQLFHRKKSSKSPLHVVLEECQMYIPQKTFKGEERMLGAMEDLCKLGRNYGIGYSLISQRPQAVNKDVVNQTGTVYAFRMTGPQERKVMEGWLSEQTGTIASDMIESLPFLENGECWAWSPQWLKVFKRVRIAKKLTFDASATPVFGAKVEKSRTLAPVDLEQLKTAMASTIEKAKSEDPKALKMEIVRLKAELAKGQKPQTVETVKEVPAVKDEQIKTLQTLLGMASDLTDQLDDVGGKIVREIGLILEGLYATQRMLTVKPVVHDVAVTRTTRPSTSSAIRSPGGAEQRILDALSELAALGVLRPERVQVAFLANYSNLNSKGFVNALGALRSAGLIDYPEPGRVILTREGAGQAVHTGAPRTNEELQERVLKLLGGVHRRVLEPLIIEYPYPLDRSRLMEKAGYGNANSKGFVNALGRLRSLGFIDYPEPGKVQAQPVLFVGK